MIATEREAMAEFACNVGYESSNANRQWLLSSFDVWVINPHYHGPDQRHPDDEDSEYD